MPFARMISIIANLLSDSESISTHTWASHHCPLLIVICGKGFFHIAYLYMFQRKGYKIAQKRFLFLFCFVAVQSREAGEEW